VIRISSYLAAACLVAAFATGCGGAEPETAVEAVSKATPAQSGTVPRPKRKAVVVLSGAIGNHNDGARLALDLDTLERLALVRYRVRDPWVKREVVYTGVLLSDLLELARASGSASELRLTALDDYKATIAVADVRRWPVLLATRSDGKRMSVADGGPTRVVFPYGQHEFDRGRYDQQWIWSVKTIVAR
jgi:hypothetical protein